MTRYVAVYYRPAADPEINSRQRDDLERYLTAFHSRDVIVWFGETPTAPFLADRPEWTRLEKQMREGQVQKLIVWRFDRLGRSAGKLSELFEQLREWGVEFLSLSENFSLGTAIGRLFSGILASLADWEREALAIRLRGAREQRLVRDRQRRNTRNRLRKLTPQKRRKIKEMHGRGIRTGLIAREVGLSGGYVRQILREDIQPPRQKRDPAPRITRHRHSKVTPEGIQLLRELVQQNVSRGEIARRLGISRGRVYPLIRMYCGEEHVHRRSKLEHALLRDPELASLCPEDWGIPLEYLLEPEPPRKRSGPPQET